MFFTYATHCRSVIHVLWLKKTNCSCRGKNRYSVFVLVKLGTNAIFNSLLLKLFHSLTFILVLFTNIVKFGARFCVSVCQGFIYRKVTFQNQKYQKRARLKKKLKALRGMLFLYSTSDVPVQLSLPCGCIISIYHFKVLYSKIVVFSLIKDHEHGIQDKAILFADKCEFVYKD